MTRVENRQFLKRQMVAYKDPTTPDGKQGTCSACQRVYPDYLLQFHHISVGTPLNTLVRKRKFSWTNEVDRDVILNELDKTVMLCNNCHTLSHLSHKRGY